MAVREWNGEVLFLRRVIEQPASRSYGIEVARLAGLPGIVVARAREILNNLETGEFDEAGQARLAHRCRRHPGGVAPAWTLHAGRDGACRGIGTLEIERMTPVEALNALARAVGRLKQGGD